MGDVHSPDPVLLIVAVSSRNPEALKWSESVLTKEYGQSCLCSPAFAFTQTGYYEKTMGTDLLKQFLAFQKLIDPAELPGIKHRTNKLEVEYAEAADHAEPRPLNLDPGYISQAKLILASTKDHWHRIYLADGIYAEVTLHYQKKAWQQSPWTYPDYQTTEYKDFFETCRAKLRDAIRNRSD